MSIKKLMNRLLKLEEQAENSYWLANLTGNKDRMEREKARISAYRDAIEIVQEEVDEPK